MPHDRSLSATKNESLLSAPVWRIEPPPQAEQELLAKPVIRRLADLDRSLTGSSLRHAHCRSNGITPQIEQSRLLANVTADGNATVDADVKPRWMPAPLE